MAFFFTSSSASYYLLNVQLKLKAQNKEPSICNPYASVDPVNLEIHFKFQLY